MFQFQHAESHKHLEREGGDALQMSRQWNLFARELDAILAERDLGLGHLDDRVAIHRERVRRLQRSLHEPRFHILPPEDIESICDSLQLSPAEVARLKAAILATAIEAKLMDRINPDDALTAAEQLLPLLNAAILAHDGETIGIGQIKANSAPVSAQPTQREQFEAALDRLDAAFIALNLAYQATSNSRLIWARDAQTDFRVAIQMLHALDDDLRDTDTWRMWRDEVQRGLQQAEELMR